MDLHGWWVFSSVSGGGGGRGSGTSLLALVCFGVFVCVLGEESRNRPGVNFRGFHGFWKRIPRGDD